MSSALTKVPLTKRLKDSLATRPKIQITHTRGGRQSLAPFDINREGLQRLATFDSLSVQRRLEAR